MTAFCIVYNGPYDQIGKECIRLEIAGWKIVNIFGRIIQLA